MDELVERVRGALAAEYPGAPNGRVRDVPDRRAIRWYTTIGLVDKPLGMRGRTALYGPRHLQQLVAIKRMQADGRRLADIQVDFTWLTPSGLDEIARVPKYLLAGTDDPATDQSPARDRFWAHGAGSLPAPAEQSAGSLAPADPDRPYFGHTRPLTQQPDGPALPRPVPSAVALGGDVVLVVPRPLTDRDRDDIATAAAPLMALLAERGLVDGRSA